MGHVVPGTTKASALETCPVLHSVLPIAERAAAQGVVSNQLEIFRFWITFEFWNCTRERTLLFNPWCWDWKLPLCDFLGAHREPRAVSVSVFPCSGMPFMGYAQQLLQPRQRSQCFSFAMTFKKETHGFMERKANGSPMAAHWSLTQDQVLLKAVVRTWDKKGPPKNTRVTCHCHCWDSSSSRYQSMRTQNLTQNAFSARQTACRSPPRWLSCQASLSNSPVQWKTLNKIRTESSREKNIFWLL